MEMSEDELTEQTVNGKGEQREKTTVFKKRGDEEIFSMNPNSRFSQCWANSPSDSYQAGQMKTFLIDLLIPGEVVHVTDVLHGKCSLGSQYGKKTCNSVLRKKGKNPTSFFKL